MYVYVCTYIYIYIQELGSHSIIVIIQIRWNFTFCNVVLWTLNVCASHLHLAMNTKCCVPLTCTLLSLCLAFNIVWLWLLLYLVMGSFPLQGLGLWRIETKNIDLRKTVLCWNCETLHLCCYANSNREIAITFDYMAQELCYNGMNQNS